MSAPRTTPRRLYEAWIEEQIEDFKAELTRDELLDLADEAVRRMADAPDGQYALTEILLRDAVDALILRRLALPGFRQWLRLRRSDTPGRPLEGTVEGAAAAG